MNAAGIALFYGAIDRDVALAEARPPVGSKVLIGCFDVVRPLMLLDMEALEQVASEKGSIFDPDYVIRLERAAFLRRLSRRISDPVMPGDCVRDYLPTQAIAEFLAAMDEPLDGILYPSVQYGCQSGSVPSIGRKDKRNVVLFRKTARVQPLVQDGAEMTVESDSWVERLRLPSTDATDCSWMCDAPDLRYTVYESGGAPSPEDSDAPLRLTDLEVLSVRAVEFKSDRSQVRRIPL